MKTKQLSKQATKALLRMPKSHRKNMNDALNEIANGNTKGKNIVKLHGTDGYRLRRGNYRAIYNVTENGIDVLIIKPRGDAYK